MLRLAQGLWLILFAALPVPVVSAQSAPTDTLACVAFPLEAPLRASPDTTFDVVHADVAVDLAEDGAFSGRTALDFRLTRDAHRLHIVYPAGEVDSVFFGTAPLGTSSAPGDTLRLALPDTVAAGSLARVVVYHRGRFSEPAPQVYTSLDPLSIWFPSLPNEHDRFTADLHITAPASWAIAASGVLAGQQSSTENTMTYRYASPYELPGRRIGLAAGSVDLGTDFAVLPGGRRPALTWWMARERPSGRERSPGATVSAAGDRLAFYSEWTGFPLPFERYTHLLVDGPSEASAGIARVAPRAEPDDRSTQPYEPSSALTKPLLQQWFGALVSADSWQHVWLEEAFAAYLHVIASSPADAGDADMAALRDQALGSTDAFRPLVWDRWNHPSELLDVQFSSRGAWVLHMMRLAIGEDAFREAVHRFLDTNQYAAVNTTDWLRAVEASSDSDLSTFSEQWIYGAGHPVLGVSYSPEGDVHRFRIEQLQTGDLVPAAYTLDLTLEIGTLGAVERVDVHVDDRVEVIDVPIAAQPRYVAVDPDARWLLASDVDQSASAWIAQLRYATTPAARLEAARALSRTPQDPTLLLGLRAALEAETNPSVRAAIVGVIGSLPPSAAAERALIAAYEDPDASVRRSVLTVLADTASTGDAAALVFRAAQADVSYLVQAEAVRTLAVIGSSGARDVARAALVTPSHDEVIREAGLDALAVLRDQAPDEALREGLRYASREHPIRLRLAATDLLGSLAPESTQAVDHLLELLDDPEPAVVTAAVEALHAVGLGSLVSEHVHASTSGPTSHLLCP